MVPSGPGSPRRGASPIFPFRDTPTAPPSGSGKTLMTSRSPSHLDPPGRLNPARSFGDWQRHPIHPREREGVRTPPPPRAASFLEGGTTGFPSSPLGGSSFPAIASYRNKNDNKDKSNVSKCKVAKKEGHRKPGSRSQDSWGQALYGSAPKSFPLRVTPVGEDRGVRPTTD